MWKQCFLRRLQLLQRVLLLLLLTTRLSFLEQSQTVAANAELARRYSEADTTPRRRWYLWSGRLWAL